ncbi:MAG: hypothetical protein HC830_00545 [Bacteroidetes bacterium]|nr:hypothetical protein [Bacteroidota bacterium]
MECHISSWDENTGKCDVIYFNKNKKVIEHIHGYKVKSMEPKANYPASTELNDINTYIHKKVKDEFAAFESKFSENLHLIAYKHDDSFDKISKKDRRVIEQQLLDRHNNAKQALNGFGSKLNIIWNGEGKPHLDPNTGKISISHSKSLLLMTIGNSEQGCDLEFIENRTREEWTGMLGQNSGKLVDRLMETDKDYDLSATRMWCLQEACIKAFGELPADVSVISTEQRAVFVEVKYQENTNHLITLPIQLFPNVTYMVAVVVKLKGEKPVVENKKPYNIDNIFDTDLRKFVTHFYTAFKDCRGFHGKTHFADIPLWMGNLREYILTPVKKKLLKDLGSGEYGMVTNDSTVRIYEEAGTLDKITGRLWITDKSDLKNSLIDLGYEWLKHTDDGKLIRIADCELSTTWVKIEDRGIVKLSPIPEYFYTYLESHLKNGNSEENLGSVNYPGLSDLGVLIYESPAIPRPSILLNSKSYQTGIYNANTVGNLYYSNYYDWQAKNIESHFFKIIPELYLKNGKAGEYICLEANVNHLQEAMPFEEIEVNMYLEQLYEKGIKLYFEYYSGGSEGKKKLAYGYNILLWAQRKDEESVPAAIEVPATVVKSLGIPVEVKKGVPN